MEVGMYPRARLDALTDGIFGVAMTLLVLDVRLPDEFHPKDVHDLVEGLLGLTSKFIPYVLSFLVLGLRWLSNIQVRSRTDAVGKDFTGWWLLYLLLITCVPLSTIIVGRFSNLAPAIWVYAGNTALIAVVSFLMLAHTPNLEQGAELHDRQISLAILMATSLVMVLVSFFEPRHALWVLALNLAAPFIAKWTAKAAMEPE
jgi:uncharacterized membrane protein